MTGRYSWIPTRPLRPALPDRPARHDPSSCERCGYAPLGRRKKCPACLATIDTEREAGHGGFDQVLYVVLLLIFVLLLLRLVGVTVR